MNFKFPTGVGPTAHPNPATATTRCLTLAFAVMLASTACTGRDINDNPNAGTAEQQYATLAGRPDIDEVTAPTRS